MTRKPVDERIEWCECGGTGWDTSVWFATGPCPNPMHQDELLARLRAAEEQGKAS